MGFTLARLKVLNLTFMAIFGVGSLCNLVLIILQRRNWSCSTVVSATFHIIYVFPCPAFTLGVLFEKRELLVPLLLVTIHSSVHNVYLIVISASIQHTGVFLVYTIFLYIFLFIQICLNLFGLYLKIALFNLYTYDIKRKLTVEENMRPYCLERFGKFY